VKKSSELKLASRSAVSVGTATATAFAAALGASVVPQEALAECDYPFNGYLHTCAGLSSGGSGFEAYATQSWNEPGSMSGLITASRSLSTAYENWGFEYQYPDDEDSAQIELGVPGNTSTQIWAYGTSCPHVCYVVATAMNFYTIFEGEQDVESVGGYDYWLEVVTSS
jgi:hypothetical protein